MSSKKISHIYEVRIAGEEVRLRSDEPQRRVEKLTAFVDQQVRNIHKNSNHLSLKQALILTCLDLSGRLYDCKNQSLDHLQEIEREAMDLKKEFQSSLNF